jgi:UDP-glucose 4-epimerase
MKRILVTGSKGYIGENLVKFLESTGYEVIGIDSKKGQRAENFPMYDNIDGIIHLAAIPGIAACEEKPAEAIASNLESTIHMFNMAEKNKIPCVFTSSQAAKEPKSSIYAFTKYASEIIGNRLIDKGARIRVLRLSNVYGGYKYLEKKNSVVARFAKAALAKESFVVHGDGTQTRDFIHVDDVCRAIYLALLTDSVIDLPIDIGTGIETPISTVAFYFKQYYKAKFTFDFESGRIGKESNVADTKDAEKVLDFRAKDRLISYVESLREEQNERLD